MSRGKYRATPPTLADGEIVEPNLDVNGNLQIAGNIDLDVEASDLGAGAAAANCGNGVTQHLDNGAGKRVAALGDAAGHQQVDVLTAPAVRALTNADVVTAEVSKDAVMGTTADGPSTDDESTTVRTGISLWKGIKNYLKTLAGAVADGHVQVDVVSAAAITGAVTTSGTVTEASASAIKTALEIIDDWDASDHCNIRHLTATDDVVVVNEATSVVAETVQVNAAAVVAAAWSVIDATATLGKRYALVIVSCNKAHTIEFYGDSADFNAITTAHHIKDSKRTGCADNSATGGDSYLVPCAGHAYFGLRVQNNDGAAAATVTVAVSFFDS